MKRKDNKKRKKILDIISVLVLLILIILLIVFFLMQGKIYNSGNKIFDYINLENSEVIYKAFGERRQDAEKDYVKISQVSDVLISIETPDNMKEEEKIKEVVLNNIQVIQYPQKGEVSIISPSDDVTKLFNIAGENQIGKKLTYIPDDNSDVKILFRMVNRNIAEKEIEKDAEIVNDISLITNENLSFDELSYTVRMDLNIILNNNKKLTKVLELKVPKKEKIESGENSDKLYLSDDNSIKIK